MKKIINSDQLNNIAKKLNDKIKLVDENNIKTDEYDDDEILLDIYEIDERAKTLKDQGEIIFPVTHESIVLDNNGTSIGEKINNLKNSIDENSSVINELKTAIGTIDAITLNGYSLWVGTTEELEAIEERDANTLYFEIVNNNDDENEVVQVNVIDGILTLTKDKYQKTIMENETEIIFPEVSRFTEIHLYFDADENMDLTFPNCKWRAEPNIEEGKSYEIICTYNTINWLVDIMVYS